MGNKVSAVIITYNEEAKIERTLKALDFVDEIVVVDSFSKDKTVEICEKYGAKVHSREFNGHGEQKNFAATLVKNDWILSIDADEEVTSELKKSILDEMNKPAAQLKDIYQLDRLNFFCETPIFYGGWYPDFNTRLYRKDKATWTQPHVHEKLQLNQSGAIGTLSGKLNHYTFDSIQAQVQTNLKYAKMGSKDLLKRKGQPSLIKVILRPIGKFIECYFLKKGILDGSSGLIIAINAGYSLFLKYAFAYRNES